jgi:hypothetical protein
MTKENDMTKERLVCEGKENDKAEKEIYQAIKVFSKTLKKIGKTYKNAGIGDTVVDENIASAVFDEIHL